LKSQSDIAEIIDISVDTLQNYKKLTELVPELQDWVELEYNNHPTTTKNEDAETSPLLNCYLKYPSR